MKKNNVLSNKEARCSSDMTDISTDISTAQLTSTKQTSENEPCTLPTLVKQYIFSSSLRCDKQVESRSHVNVLDECLQDIPTRRQLEYERSFQSSHLLDIGIKNKELHCSEDTLPLKLLTDFDQSHSMSDLKLPDPVIHSSEETSPKGHSRNTSNFDAFQLSLSTGYPFDSYSTGRKYSRENGSFSADNFKDDLENKNNNDYENEADIKLAEKTCKLDLSRNTEVQTYDEPKYTIEEDEKVLEKNMQKVEIQDEKESAELKSLFNGSDDIESLLRIDLDQVGETYPLSSMECFSESPTRNTQSMPLQHEGLNKSNRKTLKEEKTLQQSYRNIGNTTQTGEPVLLNVQSSLCNSTLSCLDLEKDNFSKSTCTGFTNPNKAATVSSYRKDIQFTVQSFKRKKIKKSSFNNRRYESIFIGISLSDNSLMFSSSMKDIGKNQNQIPKFGSFYQSSRGDESKKEKLGKIEAVTVVNKDSGFCSGSINIDKSCKTKMQDLFKSSPTKLLHECLKRDIILQKLSRDFFLNLKILKTIIEDEEERHTVKQISRELHFTHQSIITSFPGLNSYFDRLNNGPPLTTREQMHYEWLRLSSFHNYTGNGNALALARNGFYHDHNNGPNSTRCYLCEAQYSDWEMFDDIPEQHRRQSPNCPFHGNHEDESVNVSITYGEVNDQPTRSTAATSTGGSIALSTVSSSSAAASVTEVASSLQGTSISQTGVGNSVSIFMPP